MAGKAVRGNHRTRGQIIYIVFRPRVPEVNQRGAQITRDRPDKRERLTALHSHLPRRVDPSDLTPVLDDTRNLGGGVVRWNARPPYHLPDRQGLELLLVCNFTGGKRKGL